MTGHQQTSLIARFMGPTWGPPGADRTQVGPMLAPSSSLSGILVTKSWHVVVIVFLFINNFVHIFTDLIQNGQWGFKISHSSWRHNTLPAISCWKFSQDLNKYATHFFFSIANCEPDIQVEYDLLWHKANLSEVYDMLTSSSPYHW